MDISNTIASSSRRVDEMAEEDVDIAVGMDVLGEKMEEDRGVGEEMLDALQ